MNVFLDPSAPFFIDLETKITANDFGFQVVTVDISEGGPIGLRTASGREHLRLQQTTKNPVLMYDILPEFIVSGIDKNRVDDLHSAVVQCLVLEIMKRSRVSEVERGK